MRPLLSLEALLALDMIAQKQSFRAAAEALHKVPSALTYTMQKLEEDLGVSLFNREGHRAQLTEAGQYLLAQGRQLLLNSQQLAKTTKAIATGWESEINIAFDTIFGMEFFYPQLQEFHQAHPEIRLNISEECLTGTWEALKDQRADLILATSHQQISGEYHIENFMDIEFAFCVSPQHRLAKYQGVIQQDQLSEETIIIVRDSAIHLPSRTVGFDAPARMITVQRMEDKIQAQLNNLGVGFLPKFRIQHYLDDKRLIELAIDQARPPVNSFLVWPKQHKGHALKILAKLLSM